MSNYGIIYCLINKRNKTSQFCVVQFELPWSKDNFISKAGMLLLMAGAAVCFIQHPVVMALFFAERYLPGY